KSSTPLRVLQRAIEDKDMREMLMAVFNDRDSHHTHSLETAIKALPNIGRLKYEPKVHNEEVGDKMVNQFASNRDVPALFFIDPWGYKGLSLRLINSVIKDWGCDCIFFFNYNRINLGLSNSAVKKHIDVLFGEDRADRLRQRIQGMESSDERESTIMESLTEALQ